jgi:hypothetical protein
MARGCTRLAPGLALAFALAAPAGSAWAQTPPAAAVDPARLALGTELAKITNGENVSNAQLDKMLSDTMPKALAANPDIAAMERKYPGIIAAMLAAMRPLFEAHVARDMPRQWPMIGRLYAERMSAPEIQATIAFYRSTTGQRVIQLMGEESDYSAVINQAIAEPDSKITESGLRSGVSSGIAALQRRLTPAEIAEVARFEASPAGLKLRGTIPVIQSAIVAMGNEPTPELDAQLEKAMQDVVATFTSERPKP